MALVLCIRGCHRVGRLACRGERSLPDDRRRLFPTGNQVSLEKNVLFFQNLLIDRHLANSPHDIFFSDGDAPGRDLQYFDPALVPPRINQLVAHVFDKEDDLDVQYRTHAVPGISGGSCAIISTAGSTKSVRNCTRGIA